MQTKPIASKNIFATTTVFAVFGGGKLNLGEFTNGIFTKYYIVLFVYNTCH